MTRIWSKGTLFFLMALAISCSSNRCSPTAPDEPVSDIPEIAYRYYDGERPNLRDKLHVLNVETGAYRVVGDIDDDSPIVWRTKTGALVHVYTPPSGNERYLLLSNADGSDSTIVANLSSFPGVVRSLSLSPDQDSIAVAVGEEGFFLYKMETRNAYTKVGAGKISSVKFSPHNKKLALLIADSTAVYIVNTSGKIEDRIGLKFSPEQLQWSPDGKKIACWNNNPHAVLVEIASKKVSKDLKFADISWSPDSKAIVFSDSHTNLGKIVLADSSKVLLGTTGTNVQWSPNGKYLAFCEPYDSNLGLFISDVKGGNKKQVATFLRPSFAWRPL